MASQGAKRQGPEVVVPPVRTRSPRVPKGDPVDYTRFRIGFNDPDVFMDFMRGYPDTKGVTIFLYRLVPAIDLSLIGLKESNIQKGGFADLNQFSVDAVAEKFGRGKYNLKVTDSNRPDGQREVVKNCQFKLSDCEKPPVYDVRTLLLSHPDNIDEITRLIAAGTMVRDVSGVPRLRTAADGVAPAVVAAPSGGSGDLLTRELLSQVLIGALGRASASPHDTVKDTIEIARLLHPPTAALDVETIVERVVARMGGRSRNGAAEPVDPFAIYERIDGFLQRHGVKSPVVPAAESVLSAVTNGASDAAKSWMPFVPAALNEARLLLPELTNMLRELRAERAAVAPGQNGNGGHEQVKGPAQLTLEQRVEQIFQLGFQKMRQGVNGFDFAAYVCGFHEGGLEVFQMLEPQGAVGLIALAAMSPKAAPLVNDPQIRPQLETFLSDFFSFDPFPEDSESEDAAGSASATS